MSNLKLYGLDIDINKVSGDKIIERLGIHKFENNQLLEVFLENLEDIDYAFKNYKNVKREAAILDASPSAYLIYHRFYQGVVFRYPGLSSRYQENDLRFWNDSVAIQALLEKLIRDNYLTERNLTYKERFSTNNKKIRNFKHGDY